MVPEVGDEADENIEPYQERAQTIPEIGVGQGGRHMVYSRG